MQTPGVTGETVEPPTEAGNRRGLSCVGGAA